MRAIIAACKNGQCPIPNWEATMSRFNMMFEQYMIDYI